MRSAQEIAREELANRRLSEMGGDARAAAYFRALSEIAALPSSPASAPFALPVDAKESVRVSAVVSVWRMSDETVAIRTCPTSDETVFAKPPYAAAWLALFGVPSKEASK